VTSATHGGERERGGGRERARERGRERESEREGEGEREREAFYILRDLGERRPYNLNLTFTFWSFGPSSGLMTHMIIVERHPSTKCE